MTTELVYKIESYFPSCLVQLYRDMKPRILYYASRAKYWFIKRRLKRQQRPLKVVFIGITPSLWKYDYVYRLMAKESVFEPIVLIAPVVNQGDEHMVDDIIEMRMFCERMGYQYVLGFDPNTRQYIGVNDVNPDIVMYGNPYMSLIDKRCSIDVVKHALPCYVHYAYANLLEKWEVASLFHMRVWRHFVECQSNLETIKRICPFAVSNRVVTGYPMFDVFANKNYQEDEWKIKDKALKRVIYAPHHTIEGQTGMMQYSTFLENGEFMLQLAEKFKGQVQFVFKPHPVLKSVLYRHPQWGKQKTDAYYEQWANGENTTFINGAYVNLFNSSDALIHDCSSFIMEYHYTGKPVMFLTKYAASEELNEAGQVAFNSQYLGDSHEEIENFIMQVVLEGNDTLQDKRQAFFQRYLLPPNGCSVAVNIIADIKKQLGKIE